MIPPVTLMALVVGPIEPATKRGFAGFENSSAALRASSAAARLIFVGVIAKAVFRQHYGVLPNEFVSMMSEPASRYLR